MSNRIRSISVLAVAAALVLSIPGVSEAHQKREGSGFYLEGGGGIEWFNLPGVEAIVQGGGGEIGQTDGSFFAETGFLTLGFADLTGLQLPDPIGENARIELSVRYAGGDSDNTVDNLGALGFVAVHTGLFANGTGGALNEAFYETELDRWDVDLLYQTDVRLSDWATLTPTVGITWAMTTLQNEYTVVVNGIDLGGFFGLEDDVRTHYGGAVLGGDLTLTPFDFLALRLGFRADLMGATALMKADQNLVFGGSVANFKASDRETGFAARTTASAGVALRFGRFELGVDGFARYNSFTAMPHHPTEFGVVTDEPSFVEDRSSWSAGATASLTIWLP